MHSGRRAALTEPHPEIAFLKLARRMPTSGVQTVSLSKAAGRILAKPLIADRDGPPFDCSAMDGFAIRLREMTGSGLPVCGETRMGHAPSELKVRTAMRISTGAAIPKGADAVIPVENVNEVSGVITLSNSVKPKPGQHIRRRGENAFAGDIIIAGGTLLGSAHIAAMAAFGEKKAVLFSPLRVAVIATGDELAPLGHTADPWHIIDSNSPGLSAAVSLIPWLQLVMATRASDDATAMREALYDALSLADIVLTTGGVSRGHRDFMPHVIRAVGGEIMFHRLPIRPGGPVLGALTGEKVIFGLPGNPVSALLLWRRFVLPCVASQVGCGRNYCAKFQTQLLEPLDRPHEKWNYRLVQLVDLGNAKLIRYAGSGDIPAAAMSDGFIEVPPNITGHGAFPFFSWSIT